MNLPIYADTQLFIEKDMKITWQEIKDIFLSSFSASFNYSLPCHHSIIGIIRIKQLILTMWTQTTNDRLSIYFSFENFVNE